MSSGRVEGLSGTELTGCNSCSVDPKAKPICAALGIIVMIGGCITTGLLFSSMGPGVVAFAIIGCILGLAALAVICCKNAPEQVSEPEHVSEEEVASLRIQGEESEGEFERLRASNQETERMGQEELERLRTQREENERLPVQREESEREERLRASEQVRVKTNNPDPMDALFLDAIALNGRMYRTAVEFGNSI